MEMKAVESLSPKPLEWGDVSSALVHVRAALDALEPGVKSVPRSKRTPAELLVSFAHDELHTVHSMLCSSVCDVDGIRDRHPSK